MARRRIPLKGFEALIVPSSDEVAVAVRVIGERA
jgi:hypothetical protein